MVKIGDGSRIVKFIVGIKECSIVSISFVRKDGSRLYALYSEVDVSDPTVAFIEQDIGAEEAIFGIYGNRKSFNQIVGIGLILAKVFPE